MRTGDIGGSAAYVRVPVPVVIRTAATGRGCTVWTADLIQVRCAVDYTPRHVLVSAKSSRIKQVAVRPTESGQLPRGPAICGGPGGSARKLSHAISLTVFHYERYEGVGDPVKALSFCLLASC